MKSGFHIFFFIGIFGVRKVQCYLSVQVSILKFILVLKKHFSQGRPVVLHYVLLLLCSRYFSMKKDTSYGILLPQLTQVFYFNTCRRTFIISLSCSFLQTVLSISSFYFVQLFITAMMTVLANNAYFPVSLISC